MGLLKSFEKLFTSTGEPLSNQGELKEIPIDQIKISPFQTRRQFSEDQLEELAKSIREVGILQPPVVRPLPSGDGYELIAGERRFRAAQLAGLELLPAIVRETGTEISAQATLIENLQRVDLNPMETSEALHSLHEEFSWNQEQIAEKVGKKRSTIANYLRLLALPKSIQEGLRQQKISMGHAKVILSLSKPEDQEELYQRVVREGLTVREAESLLRTSVEESSDKKRARKEAPEKNPFIEDISDRLRRQLGTKVILSANKKNKGNIRINFQNLDDLERLLELLGVSEQNSL